MLKAYSSFLDKIEKVIGVIIVALLAGAFLIIFAQVVVRYLFHSGHAWMEESARFMIIWLSFLGASIAIRSRKHMYIDIFDSLMSEKFRYVLAVLFDVVTIGFFIVMVVLGFQYTVQNSSNFSAGLNISMVYVYVSLIVGMILCTLYAVEFAWKRLTTKEISAGVSDEESNTSI